METIMTEQQKKEVIESMERIFPDILKKPQDISNPFDFSDMIKNAKNIPKD